MYARPPAVVPVVAPARRGFNGPLAAICCLAFILFLIAATIVVALIPIYLPSKDADENTPTYYLSMQNLNGTNLGNDGPIDSRTQAAMAEAIGDNSGVGHGSFALDSDASVATVGSRRRRAILVRNKREKIPGKNCYGKGRYRKNRCPLGCKPRKTEFVIVVPYYTDDILQGFYAFLVKMFDFDFGIPGPSNSGSNGNGSGTSTISGGGGGNGGSSTAGSGSSGTTAAASTATATVTATVTATTTSADLTDMMGG